MKVKNSFPVYNTPEERAIMIQKVYTKLQKDFKTKSKHVNKGNMNDSNICTTIDRQEG